MQKDIQEEISRIHMYKNKVLGRYLALEMCRSLLYLRLLTQYLPMKLHGVGDPNLKQVQVLPVFRLRFLAPQGCQLYNERGQICLVIFLSLVPRAVSDP